MRPVTENISDKEHRWATRELQGAVEAIPAVATGTGFVHVTGGAQDAAALTATQTTAQLDVFTSLLKGLAPASGGGTSNFLRADGAWAAPAANPRVFVSQKTGTGPWTWTGLNGDAAGLRGYEIVGRMHDSTFSAIIGLQFNADTGNNYGDVSGLARSSARVMVPGVGEYFSAVINIPVAASGAPRNLTSFAPGGYITAPPGTSSPGTAAFIWTNTADAITRIDLIVASGGPVDSGTFALYALMDVT